MAGAPEAGTPSWVRKIPSSPIEELTPNQSALALTDRTGAQQNCMSLIPKTKGVPESGFGISRNIFILNNMAERVGFEPTLPFRVNTLSKRAPSATRPSLRVFKDLWFFPQIHSARFEGSHVGKTPR